MARAEVDTRPVDVKLQERFGFDEFARRKEYVETNRSFVTRTLEPADDLTIVDIACGTGLITGLVNERLTGRHGRIIGIDPNGASLKAAQSYLPNTGPLETYFYQDIGQHLLAHVAPGSADAIYLCNAIHEIPGDDQKQAVLDASYAALKPGGKLMINSGFTTESLAVDSTMAKWNIKAQRELGAKRLKGEKPRDKFEVLSKDAYVSMIENAGLHVRDLRDQLVEYTKGSLVAIARYIRFIKGMFPSNLEFTDPSKIPSPQDPDFELKITQVESDALVKSLNALEAEHSSPLTMRMNWIEFVAVK